ncbi:MAG: poly-gamma-glutamate hydrolase family protein [Bacteroidota bacterium]
MKFTSFSELKKARPDSFRIKKRNRKGDFLFFAPHAGGIEPGTSEICKWFNKKPWSYYVFEGIGKNCRELHITSTLFDEPHLIKLLGKKRYAVSIHGMIDDGYETINADIFLGGLNSELIKLTQTNLNTSGFKVITNIELPNSLLSGKEPQNVTNRCLSNMGMQIEISEKLRRLFFTGELKRKEGRSETTALFEVFCNLINESILIYRQQLIV